MDFGEQSSGHEILYPPPTLPRAPATAREAVLKPNFELQNQLRRRDLV